MNQRYSSESPRSLGELKLALETALAEVARLSELGALPRALEALRHLAPRTGERATIELRTKAENDRPREPLPDDARLEEWVERGGEVRLVFGGAVSPPRRQETSAAAAFERRQDLRGATAMPRRREEYDTRSAQAPAVRDDEMLELVVELDRVERERRMPYIVLKWFRDTALPSSGLRWTEDPDFRRDVLRDAIDAGLVITAKVPNPYNPAFPPTTLRVNREHPRVVRALPEQQPVQAPPHAEPSQPTAAHAEASTHEDGATRLDTELHSDPA
jgi:hypothetical protein